MAVSLSNPTTQPPNPWGIGGTAVMPKPLTVAPTTPAPAPGVMQFSPTTMPVLKPSMDPAPVNRPQVTVPATAATPAAPTYTPPPPPANDMRGQVVTAPTSPLQQQSQGMLSSALQQFQQTANGLPAYTPVSGPNFGAAGSTLQQALSAISSPQDQALRDQLMSQFQGLSSAPDRAQLAADTLRIQRELTEPQFQADMRAVGQKAAALGRIGSGVTTTELGDVALQREKNLNLLAQQLADQTAGQQLADRLNVFGAGTGLQGQFAGQDQSRAGLTASIAGQQAGMANATASFDADQAARQRQAMMDQAALQQQLIGSLSGVEGQQFSEGMQTAGLQSQQQGFQNQMAQQAIQNGVQQTQLQDALLNSDFQRQLAAAQAMGQFGFGNDPYSLMLNGSQYQQQDASAQQAALAQLAQQQALAQQLATMGRTGSSAPVSGAVPALYNQQPGTYYYGSN